MTQFDDIDGATHCVIHDITPGSEQKKFTILVRPNYTIAKLITYIKTFYPYKSFELLLQSNFDDNQIHLNVIPDQLIYEVPGFQSLAKNTLYILPTGTLSKNKDSPNFLTTSRPIKPSKQVTVAAADSTTPSARCVNLSTLTSTTITTTTSTTKPATRPSSSSGSCGDGIDFALHTSTITTSNNNINNNNNNNNNISLFHNSNNNNKVNFTPINSNSNNNNCTEFGCDLIMRNDTPTNNTDSLQLSPMSEPEEQLSDEDDLALGASASPTEIGPSSDNHYNHSRHDPFDNATDMSVDEHINIMDSETNEQDAYIPIQGSNESAANKLNTATTTRYSNTMPEKPIGFGTVMSDSKPPPQTSKTVSNHYVGLVNQAMTCYLNSLLQALFMTPEFRNALYRWESDNDNESKNIPYQLQKLFLNLQTSRKTAVETTDLTRSFGWDSTEAWQQHDIQELCRVMFDALERKFMTTKQANLISNLYEGKMLDYVKCLECNTEKTREDKFLDIPLPVRPFGSTVAYGNIEEALRAFVQPETLDGNNQYYCEKCNKKCDAHKGLKFSTFPYILTLHLKRFDFDYSTLHRIKLNDVVTFPQTLNVNAFVNSHKNVTTMNGCVNGVNGQTATGSQTDDCSTADSGSAMEEDSMSNGVTATTIRQTYENFMNGDDDGDEGIDLSTTSTERNQTHLEARSGGMSMNVECMNGSSGAVEAPGPYIYELFAIMIHSGSATGGHYYAYIKEFETDKWFCFNDQNVTSITTEDIERSFGGSSNKAYYSSMYTSSTNAYMLMYRQIDEERNERVMSVNEFPEHINKLLPRLAEEENTRQYRSSHATSDFPLHDSIKPRVFFYNPELRKLKSARVYTSRQLDLTALLESAYSLHNVERFAPLSRCRLVAYDQSCEEIIQSFENPQYPSVAEVRARCDGTLNFLLEYAVEGQTFETYMPGGVTWQVFKVNLESMEIDGPFFVYSLARKMGDTLRRSIATRLFVKESELLITTLPNRKAFVAYDPNPTATAEQQLYEVMQLHFKNLIYFYINIPNTDMNNLEFLGITSEEQEKSQQLINSTDEIDAMILNADNNFANNLVAVDMQTKYSSTVPMSTSPAMSITTMSHESNSEDSSLSDGDRTLVEAHPTNMHIETNGFCNDDTEADANSSPQLSTPENDSMHESMQRINTLYNKSNNCQYNDDTNINNGHDPQHGSGGDGGSDDKNDLHFFHAIRIDEVDKPMILSEYGSSRTTASNLDAANGDEDAARRPVYCLKVLADTRLSMSTLKCRLESIIGVPASYFRVRRRHETSEPLSPAHSLKFLDEAETLFVELGKTHMQPNESKAKISYMRLSQMTDDMGKLPHVCDWFYISNMTVAMAKIDLVAKLKRINPYLYRTLTVENCRLWLKGGRNPVKVLADYVILNNEVRSTIATELQLLIQEVEPGQFTQPLENNALIIFVRKWNPDAMVLEGFQEIVMQRDTEIRQALSEISGIPHEYVAYTKINSPFPCTNFSLLTINSTLSWFTVPATLEKYPLTTTLDGNVYFYKDARVSPRELSATDRRKWHTKEKTRLERLGYTSTALVSPRRERGLKIYTDSSPVPAAAATDSDEKMIDGTNNGNQMQTRYGSETTN